MGKGPGRWIRGAGGTDGGSAKKKKQKKNGGSGPAGNIKWPVAKATRGQVGWGGWLFPLWKLFKVAKKNWLLGLGLGERVRTSPRRRGPVTPGPPSGSG